MLRPERRFANPFPTTLQGNEPNHSYYITINTASVKAPHKKWLSERSVLKKDGEKRCDKRGHHRRVPFGLWGFLSGFERACWKKGMHISAEWGDWEQGHLSRLTEDKKHTRERMWSELQKNYKYDYMKRLWVNRIFRMLRDDAVMWACVGILYHVTI